MNNCFITEELFDKLDELATSYLMEDGKEVNNPKPLVQTVTPKRMAINDEIRRIIRTELSRVASAQSFETFEEANDFDVDDDFEKLENKTQYEVMENEIPKVNQESKDESGKNDIGNGEKEVEEKEEKVNDESDSAESD